MALRPDARAAPTASMSSRSVGRIAVCALAAACAAAIAQQTPPPPPTSATLQPQRTPGLQPELAEAAAMVREGRYATAVAKIDEVLAAGPKNPQARFPKGVVQTDEQQTDAAIPTFQG